MVRVWEVCEEGESEFWERVCEVSVGIKDMVSDCVGRECVGSRYMGSERIWGVSEFVGEFGE